MKVLEDHRAAPAAPASLVDILRLDIGQNGRLGVSSELAKERSMVRDSIYTLIAQLKHVEESKGPSEDEKKQAKSLAKQLGVSVEYAPWWVRILSAVCLGVGTMIGYQRIVTTLGQRLGKMHLTPAQGAAAETVSAVLIGISGFSGLPVSTTHIVTSGIAGTMVAAGAGLQFRTLRRIVLAWLVTLPVTMLIAAGFIMCLKVRRSVDLRGYLRRAFAMPNFINLSLFTDADVHVQLEGVERPRQSRCRFRAPHQIAK